MSKMLAESYIRIILYVYFYWTSKSSQKKKSERYIYLQDSMKHE